MSEPTMRQNPLYENRFDDPAVAALVVAVLSFVLGGLTAYAQTVLPYSMFSLANSANGWTALMVVLLLWVRPGVRLAAVLGSVSGVLLMLGYTAALALYGHAYDPLLWTLSGAVAGPFIGVAAAWLRERGGRAALGTAALTGVTIGESLYGLTAVSQSTSPVYWTVSGLAGLLFLLGMLARRIRGRAPLVLTLAGTAAVVVVFIPVFGTVGTYA
ncbi:DUF6518 family protein [Kineosporia sp. NBRC 101677]|uniref:DUF6518 family protein n=1 Tax=Kineosporia sp. NBRC 101677 TaxID=3032197 RepID=UPI0025535275|nr:DUF6518 family protein [Kineosporia sp. NBRC 101677]